MKALMTAEAEAIIEDLSGDQAEGGEMTLTATEEAVLGAGLRFQGMLTQALIEDEEAKEGRAARSVGRRCAIEGIARNGW